MNELEVVVGQDIESRVISAALSGLSANTCRVYTAHLSAFSKFLTARHFTLDREAVEKFVETLHELSSHNQALSACKRLAEQAAAHGWIPYQTYMQIKSIRSKRFKGVRTGHWLNREQASALIAAPLALGPDSLRSKRDRTVLALLLGCGVRRDELARLEVAQIALRDDRPVLANLIGKGGRLRTVVIPAWVMPILNGWLEAGAIGDGRVVRSIKRGGHVNGALSTPGIWKIVLHYSKQLGLTITPHDLRRTFAKLARKSGAPLEVVQKSLGHSSISTTERYMNTGEECNAGDYFSL